MNRRRLPSWLEMLAAIEPRTLIARNDPIANRELSRRVTPAKRRQLAAARAAKAARAKTDR